MTTLEMYLIVILAWWIVSSIMLIRFYRNRYLDMIEEARTNSDGWREALELATEIQYHNHELIEKLKNKENNVSIAKARRYARKALHEAEKRRVQYKKGEYNS